MFLNIKNTNNEILYSTEINTNFKITKNMNNHNVVTFYCSEPDYSYSDFYNIYNKIIETLITTGKNSILEIFNNEYTIIYAQLIEDVLFQIRGVSPITMEIIITSIPLIIEQTEQTKKVEEVKENEGE